MLSNSDSADLTTTDESPPSPWGPAARRPTERARGGARDEEERAWARVWEVDAPLAVPRPLRTRSASEALLRESARRASWEIVNGYDVAEPEARSPSTSTARAASTRRLAEDRRFDDRPPSAWTGMFVPIMVLVALVMLLRVAAQ